MIGVETLPEKKKKLKFYGGACPGTPKLLFIAIDIRLSSVYKPDPEENESDPKENESDPKEKESDPKENKSDSKEKESDPKNKSELERNPFAFETDVRVLGFRH